MLIAGLGLTYGSVSGKLPVRLQQEILSPDRPAFTGVIEVWLVETFYPGKGSFLRWLLGSASMYEQQNKGVYINLRLLTPEAARRMLAQGEGLPDAILCGGGILADTSLLAQVQPSADVLPAFAAAVCEGEACYGVPVAAGAYTVIYSAERLSEAGISGPVTGDMLPSLYKSGTTRSKRWESYAINCAATEYISPLCGMLAMLSIGQEAASALPPNLCREGAKKAWADFVLDRMSAAYVCTQKEVYRMRQLELGNAAFPWQVHEAPCLYTDQLLSLYVLSPGATKKADAELRGQAALSYARYLQTFERQTALADVGAFSVVSLAEPLYPQQSAMHYMEAGIRDPLLRVPNQFEWHSLREEIITAEQSARSAAQLFGSVQSLLEKSGEMR